MEDNPGDARLIEFMLAEPAGANKIKVEEFIQQKIGLIGEAVSDSYSPIGLVKFTEIVKLDSAAAK